MREIARGVQLFLIGALVLAGAACGPAASDLGGAVDEIESAMHCTSYSAQGGVQAPNTAVASPDANYNVCGTGRWFAVDYVNNEDQTFTAQAFWHDSLPTNATDCGNTVLNLSVSAYEICQGPFLTYICNVVDLGTDSRTGYWNSGLGCLVIGNPTVTEPYPYAWDNLGFIRVEAQAKVGTTYKKVEVKLTD